MKTMEHPQYRNIRARMLYLLHPQSQFLGDNSDENGYVSVQRIVQTRRLRRHPYELIIDVIDYLVHDEKRLEFDETRLLIRYVAAAVNG